MTGKVSDDTDEAVALARFERLVSSMKGAESTRAKEYVLNCWCPSRDDYDPSTILLCAAQAMAQAPPAARTLPQRGHPKQTATAMPSDAS